MRCCCRCGNWNGCEKSSACFLGSSFHRIFADFEFEEVSSDHVFTDEEKQAVTCFIERGPPLWVADLKLHFHGVDWMTLEALPLLAMAAFPGEIGRVQNRCGLGDGDFLWHWKKYRSVELHWRRAYKTDPAVYDATSLLYLVSLPPNFQEPPSLLVLQQTFETLLSRGGSEWRETVLRGVMWVPLRCQVFVTKKSLDQLLRAFPKRFLQKTCLWRNDDLDIRSPRVSRKTRPGASETPAAAQVREVAEDGPKAEKEGVAKTVEKDGVAKAKEKDGVAKAEENDASELEVAIANANYLARQRREALRAGAGYGTLPAAVATPLRLKEESEAAVQLNRRSRRTAQKQAVSEGLLRKKEAAASKAASEFFLRDCRQALVPRGDDKVDEVVVKPRPAPRQRAAKTKSAERLCPGVVAQLFCVA